MRNTSLEVLEGRIGYHFKDIYLLECALTHTSFANEQKIHRYKDYERLEFLGDAVLEMVSSGDIWACRGCCALAGAKRPAGAERKNPFSATS